MARDWYPLADHDPIQGDAVGIRELAASLDRTAKGIAANLKDLQGIEAGGIWEGEAANAFLSGKERVMPKLSGVLLRYESTVTATNAWADAVEESQRQGGVAQHMALDAQDRMTRARAGLAALEAEVDAAGGPVWGPNWQGEIDDATRQMETARRLFDEARNYWKWGEDRFVAAMKPALHDHLRNHKSGWGGIASHFPNLKTVAEATGVASAVLGVAGFVFPPAEGAALALRAIEMGAFALGTVSTAAHTTLAVEHKEGWGEAGIGLVGLASFGIGHAFAVGARGEAGAESFRQAGILERRFGTPGALKGLVTNMETEEGLVRPLIGAAARDHLLKILPDAVEEYGTEAAGRFLPSGRNWLTSFRQWDLELPGREILDLSPRAARLAGVSQWAEAINVGHDGADLVKPGIEGLNEGDRESMSSGSE